MKGATNIHKENATREKNVATLSLSGGMWMVSWLFRWMNVAVVSM